MNAAALIDAAAAEGVQIRLSPVGEPLHLRGANNDVERWMMVVKKEREEIISLLMEREERAAIYEYDAKLSRKESERRAGII